MSDRGFLAGWFREHRHYCIGLLRIWVGIGLAIKGLQFIGARDDLVRLLLDRGVPLGGAALAHVIILTHMFGGTLMAVGFATRIGALVQIPNLVGATFFVHSTGGLFAFAEELRFSALVLFILVLFVWHGSGPLSLDAQFSERGEGGS